MERIYKIESVLRKSNTIIIIQGNYDRIYNYFNHNNGDGRFLKYTKLKGIAQEGLTKKDLDKCDFLRTFCCFPIFSQRFVDRLSHILKDEVIFYPIEICCENQKKDFYAAKILNYMDVIDHQQTELQAQNDDSSLFSIPPIIANRCLKDFYIARDTKDTYEWFISEKLKNILIKEKFAMKLVNPENKTEQEECRKNTRRTPTLKTGKVSSIKNEATIRSYIDKCLELVQEHKEYLMYVASYEPTIEPEMQDFLDNNLLEGKSPKIYVTQPGRTNYMVDIITEKDHIWKAIDSQISDEDIDKLEGELNVILPLSYKSYLKYKHFYEIFWDIDVFLYPKPIHSWDKILIEENQEMQEEILDEGYFAIGRYSDHGVIVLKLTDDENKEGGVFLFDCETQEVKVLEPTFTEFLNQILHNPKPVLQEIKNWEKKCIKWNNSNYKQYKPLKAERCQTLSLIISIKTMRFLKIMGIFTSILSLLSCGHGNKRVTQNDGINSNIPVAARITIDKLPDVLRNVQAGNTDYDFIGICSNGVDCIYFVLENGKFYIDFEAMGKEQLPYIDTLKQFAKEHNYPVVETTYNNTPVDYEHLKYAPVISLKVHADIDSIVKVGSQIEQTIFKNSDRTVYEIVP